MNAHRDLIDKPAVGTACSIRAFLLHWILMNDIDIQLVYRTIATLKESGIVDRYIEQITNVKLVSLLTSEKPSYM